MAKYSTYEQQLFKNVEDHGWQFSFVFDDKGTAPDFGYSVGFSKSIQAPEFIIFGLPKELMHNMLWEVYKQIENGAIVEDGKPWSDLLEGFDCISRKAIHKDLFNEYTTHANWFWRETGNDGHPEVFQLVWPGAQQGLFPWEADCAQDVIDMQPHLWLPK
ncbi:MAG: DUF4262 domain-containing protein [Maricaulaceae bacterium]